MQLIVEKRGYRFLPFLVLAVAVAMLGFLVLNTEAVHNDKLLELDGNVVFNAGGRGANPGDSPCDGALPTSAPFFTPGPPDCIQTATPATFDWAGSAVGNGTGVCKAGADNPATAGNEANLIDEDTKPAGVSTSVCVRDFAVGTVDGPALGQGTLCQPSSTCSVGDTADLSYHTGSDKDFQEIWDGSTADWGCVEQSNATNKADLLNSYFVRTTNQAGDTIFYFGAERASENGSVFNGFWFLQNRVNSDCPRNLVFPSGSGDFCSQTPLENATCTPASNQSKHKNKDTLILFNYDNGGRIGSIGVYVWDYGALASSSPGLPCPNGLGTRTTADHLCQVENLDVNAGGKSADCRLRDTINSVCGRVNGSPTCVPTNSKPQYCSGPGAITTPWAPACGTGTNCRQANLPSPTFSEAGVNLTKLGITIGCVQSFLSESRSAPSVDATLKDYALGGLPPCGLAWEKRDETVSGNPLQGGATFTITPSPFGGASLVVTDCTAAPCAAGGDDDPDAGSFNLSDVGPNTYQVCETTAPTGYARDNNLCRSVTVTTANPNEVIGTQDTDDCANATADEQDFCNRRGTVAWEKRDGSSANALQGGATFTVSPNPDACVDADNTGSDDTSPITVVDNGTNDDSSAAGVLSIGPACLATYTITETIPPPGYALPANATRTCQVTEAALSCVVGDQGTDDCANATAAERDFCNRRGSLAWEKRDGSLSGNPLQGGATFTVAPDPDDCTDGTVGDDPGPVTVVDNGSNDDNSAAGVIEVGPACLATYTITETVPPGGYALPANATRTCQVTSAALSCAVGTQGTDDCANATANSRDFCNRRGSLAWEKRDGSLSGNPLQGGATFTVAPDPDDCTDGTVGDDPGPITVVDNGSNDDNSAAGVIEVGPACLATYTITETVPPAGYALPANASRTCQVTSAALSCAVGTQGTDDCANATANSRDFCNRRGSLAWEKRDGSLSGNPLQGGATFTVAPDPDDCTDGTVGDDPGPITVVDNGSNDDNSAAGVIEVGPACLAAYTITETVPPAGYALPANASRTCEVTSAALSCVVGDQGTDDCANATANERDFCNRRGSLAWEKRDGSADGDPLQGGATFTVSPDPDDCTDGTVGDDLGPVTVVDNGANDDNSAAGQLSVGPACLAFYSITETVAPPGYALPANPTRSCAVNVSDLNCSVGTEGLDDCQNGAVAERDFCNRLGSIQWEKRSDIDGNLQGGATFTVDGADANAAGSNNGEDGPLACRTDTDVDPLTVADNGPNDADPDAGQFRVDRVCLGSYTITETVVPAGFAKDPDDNRVIVVTAAELNPVVGSPLVDPPNGDTEGRDDCPDGGDVDTDESDFCNIVGSLFWEKRGKDASTATPGDELLPGFGFTVTGTGVNVVVSDCTSGPCAPGGDQDPDAGQFCLDAMPIGVALTIDETSRATGYIQTVPADNGDLTKTLTQSSKCSGTPTDAGDFINEPLSKFEIKFICVAPSPSDASKCATIAKISCPSPAIAPTPDDATPTLFDDVDEVYGDGITTLLPGTYNCTVEIDP